VLLTGLRQKTIRKQPQTQVAQGIYTKHEKIAETQVYQENYQIEVKPLLYIGLRLFLTKKCLSPANDCIAYEDLNVTNLVRNRKLSKSISDAGWTQFRNWIEYFGWKFNKITIAVPPHYTSQDCPACGMRIKKALSTRTHACQCGYIEDRDIAASINILKKGLSTVGHTGTYAWGETPSWVVGATLPSNGDSLNQESLVPSG
jgi:transposase